MPLPAPRLAANDGTHQKDAYKRSVNRINKAITPNHSHLAAGTWAAMALVTRGYYTKDPGSTLARNVVELQYIIAYVAQQHSMSLKKRVNAINFPAAAATEGYHACLVTLWDEVMQELAGAQKNVNYTNQFADPEAGGTWMGAGVPAQQMAPPTGMAAASNFAPPPVVYNAAMIATAHNQLGPKFYPAWLSIPEAKRRQAAKKNSGVVGQLTRESIRWTCASAKAPAFLADLIKASLDPKRIDEFLEAVKTSGVTYAADPADDLNAKTSPAGDDDDEGAVHVKSEGEGDDETASAPPSQPITPDQLWDLLNNMSEDGQLRFRELAALQTAESSVVTVDDIVKAYKDLQEESEQAEVVHRLELEQITGDWFIEMYKLMHKDAKKRIHKDIVAMQPPAAASQSAAAQPATDQSVPVQPPGPQTLVADAGRLVASWKASPVADRSNANTILAKLGPMLAGLCDQRGWGEVFGCVQRMLPNPRVENELNTAYLAPLRIYLAKLQTAFENAQQSANPATQPASHSGAQTATTASNAHSLSGPPTSAPKVSEPKESAPPTASISGPTPGPIAPAGDKGGSTAKQAIVTDRKTETSKPETSPDAAESSAPGGAPKPAKTPETAPDTTMEDAKPTATLPKTDSVPAGETSTSSAKPAITSSDNAPTANKNETSPDSAMEDAKPAADLPETDSVPTHETSTYSVEPAITASGDASTANTNDTPPGSPMEDVQPTIASPSPAISSSGAASEISNTQITPPDAIMTDAEPANESETPGAVIKTETAAVDTVTKSAKSSDLTSAADQSKAAPRTSKTPEFPILKSTADNTSSLKSQPQPKTPAKPDQSNVDTMAAQFMAQTFSSPLSQQSPGSGMRRTLLTTPASSALQSAIATPLPATATPVAPGSADTATPSSTPAREAAAKRKALGFPQASPDSPLPPTKQMKTELVASSPLTAQPSPSPQAQPTIASTGFNPTMQQTPTPIVPSSFDPVAQLLASQQATATGIDRTSKSSTPQQTAANLLPGINLAAQSTATPLPGLAFGTPFTPAQQASYGNHPPTHSTDREATPAADDSDDDMYEPQDTVKLEPPSRSPSVGAIGAENEDDDEYEPELF
ncbi:hypothetical protein B0A48_03678 [Cryoendolithus antarcticus]|uniref:Uncharacterized protein n=1 Tax=Cryoendolithus antarcticus TaxID=1507870 RepID=A0A1V8TGN9_9PEZI|nr:hypothetical protein B0A48_03678 [Cryoendolithus antarcticus]